MDSKRRELTPQYVERVREEIQKLTDIIAEVCQSRTTALHILSTSLVSITIEMRGGIPGEWKEKIVAATRSTEQALWKTIGEWYYISVVRAEEPLKKRAPEEGEKWLLIESTPKERSEDYV